jgi:sugar O-acyltransferase (sialic acid O-acetyltransferase NeuD family)
MSNVIIFGINDFAELAHFYLETDSLHDVVAFTVSESFLPKERTYRGLPVLPFEDVQYQLSADEHHFFAPMSAKNMNKDREHIFGEIKSKGYRCISYVSSRATTFNNDIGENCFILENNTLQPFTRIGDNVVLWSGNHIGHHGAIADHVTFTSHVVMSGHCSIGANSFFGVNATLRDGLHVGEGTFVSMASTQTADTDPWSVYKGNPAKKLAMPSTKIRL